MKQLDRKKSVSPKVKYKVILCMLLCVSMFPAFAGNFIVNTIADDDPATIDPVTGLSGSGLTLRGAITAADNAGGSSTITVPSGTYNLNYGALFIYGNAAENITITGADSSSTIINMVHNANKDRILAINYNYGSDVVTTIQNIKFTNGIVETDTYGGGAILAGGPANVLTITACAFSNNSIDPLTGTSGGAVAIEGGGDAIIDSCSFNNNSCPTGDAGALWFDLQNIGDPSGSLSVTNCTFTSNSVNTSSGDGGALEISTQGGNSGTFSATVDNNTFINNSASGTSGKGGAISIDNGFGLGGTIDIHYNRIDNNTSTSAPSEFVISAAAGHADAIDNWWGSNTNPATSEAGGSGTVDLSDWIVLSSTETPSSVCTDPASDTSVVATSFLTTHLSNPLTTSDISTLIGLPISFGTVIDGSLIGTIPTVVDPSGIETVDYVASTPGSGSLHATIDNEILAPAISVTAVSLPTGNLTVTQNVGTTGNEYLSSCQLLDNLVPSGINPVSGSVTSEVWVESSVPNVAGMPFVARHYQIEPATLPLLSTGTITLYFTQQEFTDFNNDPSNPLPLPDSATDPSIANLRVGKYSGISGDGSGLPASYTGADTVIDPADANIVWDAVNNRWAVTFDVTSFSGFIIQTSSNIIPVNLINFTATLTTNNSATVNWNMANQSGIKTYVIEKSLNDTSFSPIATVPVGTINSYSYIDDKLQPGTSYYRLGMVDEEGKINYGPIAHVAVATNQDIVVYPDPVTDKFYIKQLSSALVGTAQLLDINGQVLQTIQITQSLQPVDVSNYPSGIYMLHFSDGSVYRIIKE
jgi:type IX secretion system substrate protein